MADPVIKKTTPGDFPLSSNKEPPPPEPGERAPENARPSDAPDEGSRSSSSLNDSAVLPALVPTELQPFINYQLWGFMTKDHPVFKGDPKDYAALIASFVFFYGEKNLFGPTMWLKFCDIFEDWTRDEWSMVHKTVLQEFTRFLRRHGVWVTKNTQNYAVKIYGIQTQPRFQIWNDDDLEFERTRSALMQRFLRNSANTRAITEEPEPWVKPAPSPTPSPTFTAQRHESVPDDATIQQATFETPNPFVRNAQFHAASEHDQRLANSAPASGVGTEEHQLSNSSRPHVTSYTPKGEPPKQVDFNATKMNPSNPPSSSTFSDPSSYDADGHGSGSRNGDDNKPKRGGINGYRREENPRYTPNSRLAGFEGPYEPVTPQQLLNLQKFYKDEEKYSGALYEVLDHRLLLLSHACQSMGIPLGGFGQFFSIMLKGEALLYFQDHLITDSTRHTYQWLVGSMKTQFETEENKKRYRAEWNRAKYSHFVEKNPEKTKTECLELLFAKLILLQRATPNVNKDDETLCQQIIFACEETAEFKDALFNPPETSPELRAMLRRALYLDATMRPVQYLNAPTAEPQRSNDSFVVDRKYEGTGKSVRFGNHGAKSPHAGTSTPTDKKCFVCEKFGCYSTNHTDEERKKAREEFKRKNGPSKRVWRSYVTLCEGDSESEEEKESQGAVNMTSVTFLTEAEEFSVNGETLTHNILNAAARHRLTREDPYAAQELPSEGKNTDVFLLEGRYSSAAFQGIMPDTGAAKFSTAGAEQVKALQRLMPSITINTKVRKATVRFGDGQEIESIGTVHVPTAFGRIRFHVMPTNTPFLLSLQDMDRLKITYNNVRDVMERQHDNLKVPTIRKWGHPWFMLKPEEAIAHSFLTEPELRQLHRRFGHPSVERLRKLLDRAGEPTEHKAVAELTRACHHCQLHQARPKRFKFTLRDDTEFNHTIIIDIATFMKRPALHVIDEATGFNAARYLKGQSSAEVWEALRACWIDVYLGPPDYVVVDQGRQFTSAEFDFQAKELNIIVKEVPIEAHNSIGKVERYHAPLRRALEILHAESPWIPPDIALQMAVKMINDTAGPSGLVPTLLVFGAYPRMTRDAAPAATVKKRAEVLHEAMKKFQAEQATRQVKEALATRNGPATTKTTLLEVGSLVVVWRENEGEGRRGQWTGPWKLIEVTGEECKVLGKSGPQSFRSTVVKPYIIDPAEEEAPRANGGSTSGPDDSTEEGAPQVNNPAEASPTRPETIENPTTATENPVSPPGGTTDGTTENTLPPDLTDEVVLEEGTLTADTIVVGGGTPPRRTRYRPGIALFTEEIPVTGPLRLHEPVYPEGALTPPAIFLSEKERADAALAVQLRAEGKITAPGEPFEESSRKEIETLIERGVFEFLVFTEEEHGKYRLFRSRLVNEIKGKNTLTPYEKSRLVVQGFNDRGKSFILTQSPTIQRMSLRLILALAPSLLAQGYVIWCSDITQAYVQSDQPLARRILAQLPAQIKHRYPEGIIMRVIRPLYGIAESGTYWWVTYHTHHIKKLQMRDSTYDPCLLITTEKNPEFACIGMQTDDTLGLSTPAFSDQEDRERVKAGFAAKPKETLSEQNPLTFNGGVLSLIGNNLILRQKGQGAKLALIDPESPQAKKQYVEQRARGAYIATVCQPEASFDLSTAAQHQDPSKEEITALNKRIAWQKSSLDRGITYIPIDLATAKLFVFVDGSFANNKDLTSQLGYVVTLGNESAIDNNHEFTVRGNFVHWSSTKSRRVTRSVLASEVYGMTAGVDVAYTLSSTLKLITARLNLPSIPLIVCTDSYSLYECLVKLGTTQEKRLMIDILALRDSYESRELHEVRWINGEDNPADAMTKLTPNRALEKLVDNNELTVRVEGWVAR